MKTREKFFRKTNLKYSPALLSYFFAVMILISLSAGLCLAVNTKIYRQDSLAQLAKGKTTNVVINSKGTIQLGLSNEVLVDKFDANSQPWSINCIAVNGTAVYFGTSPNGGIYSYSEGKLKKIYPAEDSSLKQHRVEDEIARDDLKADLPAEGSSPEDEPCSLSPQKNSPAAGTSVYLTNEHIYAMGFDISGHLIAAVSGKNCRLLRLKGDKMETVFEPNDAKYIFAIAVDKKGDIYLATGPKGKVYRLDSFCKNPQVIYHARDKNILSLVAGGDGFIYAGSDERGLVYKINPRAGSASVLYDSDQPEITSLLITKKGDLYAAGTSAQVAGKPGRLAVSVLSGQMAGRPEPAGGQPKPPEQNTGDSARRLQIANIKGDTDEKKAQQPAVVVPRGIKPAASSVIYKITPEGFVTDVFSENAIFFCMSQQAATLLVGTGNEAQLYSIDIDSEQRSVSFEDKQASQITAVAVSGDDIYIGAANPAKLIKLNKTFAKEGTYRSDLIDAGQPANWGKLQIEADIPAGCSVKVSCRSGNVKDVNDPAFSPWSEPAEITEPVQLSCPVGRFCQYQLTLKCDDGTQSPVIREIAEAATVPNLAPKVESVNVSRIEAGGREGFFKIDYKAADENGDKLVYKIDFKKIGTGTWIELKDQVEASSFEWDGKTVEDGRYEIRVTASDEKSNTPATKLTDSRISEPVIVDNTPPVIEKSDIKINKKDATIRLTVADQLSIIGKVSYTIDSSSDWIGCLPDDLVYDSTRENFTILIKDLKTGEHIIALRISDDADNTMYKSFDIKVSQE